MKPTSLTEQLMFNTVRIEAHDGSSGTGFFSILVMVNLLSLFLLQINTL